jgi:uncharacterized membrane protein
VDNNPSEQQKTPELIKILGWSVAFLALFVGWLLYFQRLEKELKTPDYDPFDARWLALICALSVTLIAMLITRFRAFFRRYMTAGLLAILPIAITLYLFVKVFVFLDSFLGNVLKDFLPNLPVFRGTEQPVGLEYIPGLGLIATLLLVLLIGFFTTNYLGARLYTFFTGLFARLPVIKTIYAFVKQVFDSFSFTTKQGVFQRVVLVEYPRKGIHSVAFEVRSGLDPITRPLGEGHSVIFVPTSPNPTSGFLIIVESAQIIPLEMTVDEGLKYIVSGGVYSPGTRRESQLAQMPVVDLTGNEEAESPPETKPSVRPGRS